MDSTHVAISKKAPLARTPNNILIFQNQVMAGRISPRPDGLGLSGASVMDDDLPTPKASERNNPLASFILASNQPSPGLYRQSTTSNATEFDDDLYNDSDDESVLVQLRCSNSVKQVLTKANVKHDRLPSLIIPSPTSWPTIEKLQMSASSIVPSAIEHRTALSPIALAALTNRALLHAPAQSATPSLDGSLTSDEHASMSCPSTPDTRLVDVDSDGWEMPIQLAPGAMDTLHQLQSNGEVAQVAQAQISEMQERGLNLENVVLSHIEVDDTEPLSAISIPSPGGFFASLGSASQKLWSPNRRFDAEPTTSIAETFYGVPWRPDRPQAAPVLERIVEVLSESGSQGPPTAIQATFVHEEIEDPFVEDDPNQDFQVDDYDQKYELKLKEEAASNMNRTSLWLNAQESYLSVLTDTNPVNQASEPLQAQTPKDSPMPSNPASPPKKTVTFVEPPAKVFSIIPASGSSAGGNSLFYHAFQYLVSKTHVRDAFIHRLTRADALRAQRLHLPEEHMAQLLGKYALCAPARPTRDFSHLPSAPDDTEAIRQRASIARAEQERQAIQQIDMSFWEVEATRFLNRGNLLPKSAISNLQNVSRTGVSPRILDLAGQPTAHWGWAVALQHRHAKVYTAVPESSHLTAPSDWLAHHGPSNHSVLCVPNLWTLPFPDNSFDVISARSLHMFLHASEPAIVPISPNPASTSYSSSQHVDEYAITLAEIDRVLAPGGILHFSLLDAELALDNHGGCNANLAAKSVEFAVALRSRGYDPRASVRFIRRLTDSGFERIERCWMRLPVGTMSKPKDQTITVSLPLPSRFTFLTLPPPPSTKASTNPTFRKGKGKEKAEAKALKIQNLTFPITLTPPQKPAQATPPKLTPKTPPISEEATEDGIEAVTGLVGSLAWERWMLRLQVETGKTEGELLKGVASALEEAQAAGAKAEWTMLVGCARKRL